MDERREGRIVRRKGDPTAPSSQYMRVVGEQTATTGNGPQQNPFPQEPDIVGRR